MCWICLCRVGLFLDRIGASLQAVAVMEEYARTKAKPSVYRHLIRLYEACLEEDKAEDARERGLSERDPEMVFEHVLYVSCLFELSTFAGVEPPILCCVDVCVWSYPDFCWNLKNLTIRGSWPSSSL
jgi:hypothetical protein